MLLKKAVVLLLAVGLLLSYKSSLMNAANTTDTDVYVTNLSTSSWKNSTTARKKTNTSSSYFCYMGASASGPTKIKVIVKGCTSSDGSFVDCTTYVMNDTSQYRGPGIVTMGTRGYIQQDVAERMGTPSYAKLGIKPYFSADAGRNVTGLWSPDSVYEAACTNYN